MKISNNIKNKIAVKLILYFSATLILFSIIIGSIFISLFKNQTMNIHKADLHKRATTIAATLSDFTESANTTNGIGYMHGSMMQGGMGSYIKSLDDIAMADVWIVDENLNLITVGNMAMMQYSYSDLPQDANLVVKEVFEGDTTFSEGFSSLLNTPTLTIGTPIIYDGQVLGALLLHSPVSGMDDAIYEGFKILAVSITIALILSIILSVVLAVSFTKPLKKMKNTALMLVDGDYSAKTDIKQNDEIGELASTIDILSERLNIASKESNKLLKLRQDFIANISHELRTPVTVIRGSLEALCDVVVSDKEQVKEYHNQMLKESKYLEGLVNDLLDLSRLQNTDFKIEMEPLNLFDVLTDAVRSGKNIAKTKNIRIAFFYDKEFFLTKGDYGRLRQMFLIIIDNAIKFSAEDSIIDISFKSGAVIIRDTGIGIAAEDLLYIFDRFYKAKNENNKKGTGLGLAIAKQIAERHNINISVKSIKGKETEFCFIFPKQ